MKAGTRKAIEIEFLSDDTKHCVMSSIACFEGNSNVINVDYIVSQLQDQQSMMDNDEDPVYSGCIDFFLNVKSQGYTDVFLPEE